ncbi:hypothetical protein [Methylobacterium bullatum]|uniref:hypothetical protein n=1 Tax=Methylobacterium bullatum TaxID=570505 RepID=UPI0030D44CE0
MDAESNPYNRMKDDNMILGQPIEDALLVNRYKWVVALQCAEIVLKKNGSINRCAESLFIANEEIAKLISEFAELIMIFAEEVSDKFSIEGVELIVSFFADERVNAIKLCRNLFIERKSLDDICSEMGLSSRELCELIYSTGYYLKRVGLSDFATKAPFW